MDTTYLLAAKNQIEFSASTYVLSPGAKGGTAVPRGSCASSGTGLAYIPSDVLADDHGCRKEITADHREERGRFYTEPKPTVEEGLDVALMPGQWLCCYEAVRGEDADPGRESNSRNSLGSSTRIYESKRRRNTHSDSRRDTAYGERAVDD